MRVLSEGVTLHCNDTSSSIRTSLLRRDTKFRMRGYCLYIIIIWLLFISVLRIFGFYYLIWLSFIFLMLCTVYWHTNKATLNWLAVCVCSQLSASSRWQCGSGWGLCTELLGRSLCSSQHWPPRSRSDSTHSSTELLHPAAGESAWSNIKQTQACAVWSRCLEEAIGWLKGQWNQVLCMTCCMIRYMILNKELHQKCNWIQMIF